MASFEQNQQDQVNMNNTLDQIKQFNAECDKATAAMRAADLEAEEELLGVRLKNLTKAQQAKLTQLNQLLELEEKSIQELAKLRLTLSNRQFAIRKQEIQKEFQLYKAEAENFFKSISKYKVTLPAEAPKKTSTAGDIKASTKTKSADAAIQKADKKVKIATYSVDKVSQDITEAISSLQELTETTAATSQRNRQAIKNQASTADNKTKPENNSSTEVKADAQKEQNFSNDSKGMERAGLGEFGFTDIIPALEAIQAAQQEELTAAKEGKQAFDFSGVITTLDELKEKGEKATSQTTVDFAGELVKQAEEAEKSITKLREFNENKEQNIRLIQLAEEQRLNKEHADTEYKANKNKAKAEAKANDLKYNREVYRQKKITALQNAFAEKQNQLTEEHYNLEDEIAYTNAHRVEILTQKEYALKDKYIKEEHDARLGALLDAGGALSAGFGHLLENLNVPEEGPDRDKQIKEDPNLSLLTQIIEGFKKDAEAADAYAAAMQQYEADVKKYEADLEKYKADLENASKNGTEVPPAPVAPIAPELPESQVSKTTIDYGNELLKSINETRKAEEEFQEFKRDQERITQLIRQKREQERIKDLEAKEREQIEARTKAETDIAFNAAHREELLAQAKEDERLEYDAEYKKLQLDSLNHLTENITAAEFARIRAETAAAEKAIAARSKSQAAFDKAFAVQKGAGTLKEKKQLIDAIVKERAAEKDWSKSKDKFKMTEITDDMSDEEKAKAQEANEKAQKARETATKVEMAANATMKALANFAQKLNQQTDKIGEKQAPIDTRLQGSTANKQRLGSYWKQLARDMNSIGAVSPYFRQEDFANNIQSLVERGISFDIKQRAFLMTIQEKIANTFDVADGTLLRLIRIQQQDTTAGRLGMESALNTFLNQMYETSEYLSDVASSVRSSLEEMQALMEGAAGTELEFQIQKWMGSLYSVGMSQDAVQGIAQAFGQIASGDVGGLTGSGTGNLIIMAANEAGKSIADILQEGLDAKETNELMQAMVNYLAEIAETSSDSRVVQQQLANVYGLKASDLKAATNLATSIKDVSNQDLTYSGMIGQLQNMASSMILRTSTGEFLTNIWDNVQYTMATQMANNPVLYILPRVATLLEEYAGGIDLPFLNVMGFGVDLNTSVAQLMNLASMSGSILGAIGPMISGLSALNTNNMLSLAGIDTSSGKAPVIARGSAQPLQNLGGASTSESGYVGNSSGEDVKNATMQDAEDDKKKQMVEAKEEEESDDVVIKAQIAAVNIYNLLEEVAHGSQSLRVRLVGGPNGGAPVLSCNCNHTDPLTGEPATSVATPGAGRDGGDNGNWVLTNF